MGTSQLVVSAKICPERIHALPEALDLASEDRVSTIASGH
jgi:hypothetical protein